MYPSSRSARWVQHIAIGTLWLYPLFTTLAGAEEDFFDRQFALNNPEKIVSSIMASPNSTPRTISSLTHSDTAKMPSIMATYLYFDTTRKVITTRNAEFLSHIMTVLETEPWNLYVEGYCDARGTRAYNMAHANRKARMVQEYMTNLGISSSRLSFSGLTELEEANTSFSLQGIFEFLAIEQTHEGCVTRLRLDAGTHWSHAEMVAHHHPFLQRIHLAGSSLPVLSQNQ